MRSSASPLLGLLLVLGACRAGAPVALGPARVDAARPAADAPAAALATPAPQAPAPQSVPRVERIELPPRWSTLPLAEFGPFLDELFPGGASRSFATPAIEELGSALRANDPLALRAALLLARCNDVRAGELFLARLERRTAVPDTDPLGCSIDLCLAAALRGFANAREVGSRLESLSFGRRPHPDLEVRVECGATACALGREKPLPFLLAILKSGTRLAAQSSSWKPIADMGFCQRRAAEALCQRAGRPCRYRPLLSLDEREEEIRALEAALAPARPTP